MESLGKVKEGTLIKGVKNEVMEKVRLMTNEELSEALLNAQNSLDILTKQEDLRVKKADSGQRSAEYKEEKRKLSATIDCVSEEQYIRKKSS